MDKKYLIANLRIYLRKTRQEPGIELSKVAELIKDEFGPAEVDQLIRELQK